MAPKHAIAKLYSSKYYSRKKLKTSQEQPHLLSGHFIKVIYKTTTCPRQPLLSGLKSGHLTQIFI